MINFIRRIFKFYLIIFIFIPNLNVVKALEHTKYENKIFKDSIYVLGPGDKLLLKVYSFQDLDSSITILPDGTINLPRIGTINISGLSVLDANKKIVKYFKQIIKNPVVYIDLIETRPVRVSISGEVQKPGIYSIGTNEVNILSNSDGGEKSSINSKGFPRVIEAIQKAGGITNDGDLKKVKLSRYNYKTKSVDQETINYWLAFNKNEIAYNPILFDGDKIFIPRATKKTNFELITESSSNLAPSFITVNVIGEVIKPGPVQVKANTSMIQSILVAGGYTKRAKKENVYLIRLNNNGNIEKNKYKLIQSRLLDKDQNPPVRDGDIIYIEKNNWTKSVDSLKTIVEPISPILNAASLYKILSD